MNIENLIESLNETKNETFKKETSQEYAKRYYKENREKHLAYVNEKIPCAICGSSYARVRTKLHHNSKKHLDNKALLEYKQELQQMKDSIKQNQIRFIEKTEI